MRTTPEFAQIPGQRGLATVAQLLEHGWSISATRHGRATTWQEPMPRVVAPHRGSLDGETRLTAQWLWAGRGVLSGGIALSAHGFLVGATPQTMFVVGETGRAKAHPAARVVRSTRDTPVGDHVGAVPVVPASRALVDAAVYEAHRPADLEQLAITVLQRGRSTLEELERELYTRPLAKVAAVWAGLRAFREGAWSSPEKVLKELIVGDGGFPPLLLNPWLDSLDDGSLVGVPDSYIEATSTAIQAQSRQFHQGVDDQGGDRWARTVEKDGDFAAVGVRVVGVTPWPLYRQPKRFLAQLRKVVAVGLTGPPARVRIRPSP